MKFSIVVHASPTAGDSALTAFRFAESVVDQGHDIYRLFFFNAGVFNGVVLAGDAESLPRRWQELIRGHNIDAVVCVTSAKKRGIGAPEDAREENSPTPLAVADGFTIGGLGQLVDAAVHSDRLMTFGD